MTRNFQSPQKSLSRGVVFNLPLRISLKPWKFSFKKNTITAKTISPLKWLDGHKMLRFTLLKKSVLEFFSTDLVDGFGSNVGNELGMMLRCKRPHKTRIRWLNCLHTPSLDIHGTDWLQYRWQHEGSFLALLSFHSEAQGWAHCN